MLKVDNLIYKNIDVIFIVQRLLISARMREMCANIFYFTSLIAMLVLKSVRLFNAIQIVCDLFSNQINLWPINEIWAVRMLLGNISELEEMILWMHYDLSKDLSKQKNEGEKIKEFHIGVLFFKMPYIKMPYHFTT